MTVPTLRSVEPNDPTSKAEPDHQYYIAYNYANLDERKKTMTHPKNVEGNILESVKYRGLGESRSPQSWKDFFCDS